MRKISPRSKIWVGHTFYFLVILLFLGIFAIADSNALGQHRGTSPHFLHFSSNLRTNLASMTDPQRARKTVAVLFEDAKMADVTIYVSSQAELYEALKSATGGETILLAAGNYSDIKLGDWTGYPCEFETLVRIGSADSESPAVISSFSLVGVQNVAFDGLSFDRTAAEPGATSGANLISSSTNVYIKNSVFEGRIEDNPDSQYFGYGVGGALLVRDSDSVSVIGNEFFNWDSGIGVLGTTNITISGNDIHDLRVDGLQLTQVQNVNILDNYIHDFNVAEGLGEHCDFIQFFTTNGTAPSSSILIDGNVLDIGDGDPTQLIFIANEIVNQGKAGLEMYYKDISISNNVLRGDHVHGITVGHTDGLDITNNTVLSISDASYAPSINVGPQSINVELYRNVVSKIAGYSGQESWRLEDNAFVQNTSSSLLGYYNDVFLDSSLFDPSGVSGYVVAPGSLIDLLGAGSDRLYASSSEVPVRAVFDVTTDPDSKGALILDGRSSFGSDGAALPLGSVYTWKLANGSTYHGPVLRIESLSPGYHAVELTVVTPIGATSVAQSLVAISGRDVLTFDSSSGSFVHSQYGISELVEGSNNSSILMPNGSLAIDIGGSLTQTAIDKTILNRFFGADSFSISFDIQADVVGTYGQLFGLHTSFLASVTAIGEFQFNFSNAEGVSTNLRTFGADLNDGELHNIVVNFDGTNGLLSISVDDQILAASPAYGTSGLMGSWPLVFGGSWGAKAFDGKIYDFDLDVLKSDYTIYVGDLDADFTVIQTDEATEDQSLVLLAGDISAVIEPVVPDAGSDPTQQAVSDFESRSSLFPELTGYKLDLAALADGSVGKLVGNSYVGEVSGTLGLVLDGANDAARIGRLHDYDDSSVLTFELSFARTGLDTGSQALADNPYRIAVSLAGDSIAVSVGNATEASSRATFIAEELGILDLNSHTLRIVADDVSDHIQMFIDGTLVVDRTDLDFTFDGQLSSRNWWNKGWTIGEGGRRDDDFEGVITDFQVDDSALFIQF